MANQDTFTAKRNKDKGYPVLAAEKFIRLFSDGLRPNQEQQAMLAAAYFVLATEENLSINRSILHLNAAVAILKQIPNKHRKPDWNAQIANAYFKRAELLEEKQSYQSAWTDYHQTIEVLESDIKMKDKDRLLITRAALSMADLMAHEHITDSMLSTHPLYFVNKAIHHLGFFTNPDDEVMSTYAYAHQTAGLCLGPAFFEEAKQAHHAALLSVFKTKQLNISPLLSDIYTCLGLLYEQKYYQCCAEDQSDVLLDHAMIYFGLSLLFNYTQSDDPENDTLALESLFEIIYRVLDPYLPATSIYAAHHLIDALIYAYRCIVEHILPNEPLVKQFSHPEALNTFVQHIYWLVMECHKKQHPREHYLDLMQPQVSYGSIRPEDIEKFLYTEIRDNVIHFPLGKIPTLS